MGSVLTKSQAIKFIDKKSMIYKVCMLSTPVPLEFTEELTILKAEFYIKLLSSYRFLKYSQPFWRGVLQI